MIELIEKTASPEYLNYQDFINSLEAGEENIHMLLGAGIGMSGEVGEFNEILKKHVWQGRDFDAEHAKKELGDIFWYFLMACKALDMTVEEVYQVLNNKLMARYTSGKFTIAESENRKEDDV